MILDCIEISLIFEARDDFFHNSKHFLLYTERAHFYRRFSIKGIRHLIFYQVDRQINKQTVQTEQTEHTEQIEQTEQTEQTEYTEQTEQPEQTEQTE